MDQEEGPVVQRLEHGEQGGEFGDGERLEEGLEEGGDEEMDLDIRNPPENLEEFLKAVERAQGIRLDLEKEGEQKKQESERDEYRSYGMILPKLAADLFPEDGGAPRWDELDREFMRLNPGVGLGELSRCLNSSY